MLDDAAKSVNRLYINNFQDKNRYQSIIINRVFILIRQLAMDQMLGQIAERKILVQNPFLDRIKAQLSLRFKLVFNN